jgi:hypothetical protein
MRQGLRSHLTYANVMATLAVFLVLSGGTAVALSGSNTVFSDDITDNEVYSADVRNDNLAGGGLVSADVRNDTQTSPAGGLGAVDLKPSSVGTSEVALNSLSGGDINESSLGIVPNANALDGIDSTGFLSSAGGAVFGPLTVGGTLSVGSRLVLPLHASAPTAGACDEPAEIGEIFLVDSTTTTLYICTTSGWVGK